MSPSTDDSKGAAVRFPPPAVPVVGLIVGIAVHRFAWPLPMGIPEGVMRYGLAAVLILLGLGLLAAAIGLFRSSGQDPAPWENTPEIISTGIYRFTRNPMYLGMGVLQAGIGVALNNAWIVILVPLVWLTIYYIAIRHEEAYLEQKFGTPYTEYKNSVRRWI